jgi:hypothetical protein
LNQRAEAATSGEANRISAAAGVRKSTARQNVFPLWGADGLAFARDLDVGIFDFSS